MNSSRRNFLKSSGLAGVAGMIPFFNTATVADGEIPDIEEQLKGKGEQIFNMCGYAAPALETVRVGFIGLGNRGSSHLAGVSKIQNVSIVALCDLREEKVNKANTSLNGKGHKPELYSGSADAWKKMCDRQDIDMVYISTPWSMHAPMAIYAMNSGKHVGVEVPVATTLDDCWKLVETSERTRKHCMMLENTCYDYFELLTLNMARQGFFGDIIHCEGAYIHCLMEGNFSKTKYWNNWRLKENMTRNGSLYPTHGMGPICQVMNVNRGDKADYLVSMSSDDFMMGKKASELAQNDDFYKPYANKKFRGNMNTTMMRTLQGRTLMIQHDVTSPRVYSRIHLISGTKGAAQKYPEPGRISTGHQDWLPESEMKKLEAKYQPQLVEKMGELAKKVGGHGGMDFLMHWRTIDCLRNGLPLDQDVYDAALWSSLFPLSELSVSKRSRSVDVPDFTRGSWKGNTPVGTTIDGGGNTGVKV